MQCGAGSYPPVSLSGIGKNTRISIGDSQLQQVSPSCADSLPLLPAVRRIRDFHPLKHAPAGRTMKKSEKRLSGWENMKLSSAVITLALAHPGIQQLEDGFFDSLRGIGTGKVFSKLLAGQGNVIPLRLFLLHHNLEHRILVEFPTLAQLANTLRLG